MGEQKVHTYLERGSFRPADSMPDGAEISSSPNSPLRPLALAAAPVDLAEHGADALECR